MRGIRISQQQIAKDLGVSQTLVSMVLNGRRKGVSEKSYEKIWDHARRMGYRPKGINTELLGSSSANKSVGLILRAGSTLYSQSPFFGHVQHGLHAYLAEKNISLLYLGVENDLDVERLKTLENPDNFLGLVILGQVSRPFLQAICKLDSRVVTISCQYSGVCNSILPNEEQSAELLVQHLMEKGHEHFAWIGGNAGTQRATSRLNAVKSALHLRGIELESKFCIEAESGDRLDGSQVANSILKAANGGTLPTAWICFNGPIARGVVSTLMFKGISVPDDVSVVAFDGTRVCEDEHPTLTAAATSPELMGRVAAEHLIEANEQSAKRLSDVILSAELTIRESSGAAPVPRTSKAG